MPTDPRPHPPAANVTGQRVLGADADPRVVDIVGPLPHPDAAFDAAVAAPVPALPEGLVRAPGRAAAGTASGRQAHPGADCFATAEWRDEDTLAGQRSAPTCLHRPPHARDALTAPGPRARELFPRALSSASRPPSWRPPERGPGSQDSLSVRG